MTTTVRPPTEQFGTLAEHPPLPATGPRRIRERLLSLDVFRGLTVAGMLLVNDPGTWSAIYAPLEHAEWHGWTPTDLIFPFFLFIVGITTHLSLSARRARGDDDGEIRKQILRRGALIFLVGLLLNGFPFFTWGSVAGVADPSFLERIVDRLYHWRIMGVLQRIGLAYLCAALLTYRASVKRSLVTLGSLLLGYWIVMTVLPVPGTGGTLGGLLLDSPARTMAAYWDRFVLDWSRFGLGNHLWTGSVTWDPEGMLSTVPAICTAILGTLAGRWIGGERPLAERINGLFAAGALGMMFGLVWHWAFPINKGIWTSSYVAFTAGMACVSIATIMWLVDVHGWKRWTKFFVIYGTNPLVAFVGSGLLARLIYSVISVEYGGRRTSLQSAIYQSLFASWLSPMNASLAFALCFVGVWFGVLYLLYRRQVFVKL
jgi:predicted acyltransferase